MTGLSRRGVLRGLLAAPMIVRTPGLLMPVRSFLPAGLRYDPDGLLWLEGEMNRALWAMIVRGSAVDVMAAEIEIDYRIAR